MNIITRRFTFDAAHRVLGHCGKCRHLHGHRYEAKVSFYAPKLDNLGMVLDFSCIKDKVGRWIDEHWDHNILLNLDDPLARLYVKCPTDAIFAGRQPFLFVDAGSVGINPTAENIANHLAEFAKIVLSSEVAKFKLKLTQVRVYETANCWADYYPDPK